jgi:carbamoyl-phosphate synthase large subunit
LRFFLPLIAVKQLSRLGFGGFLLKNINVLLTCCGGVISPSHIASLRTNPEGRKLRIIGTDMTEPCVGQYLTDKFYHVPYGDDLKYTEKILNICKEESVDVIFPASHEEAIALMKQEGAFKNLGVKIAVSKLDVLELSFNKNLAYQLLKAKGLPCPDFRVVRSVEEFDSAANELGIDEKEIVMKPVLTRGGRGARILTKRSLANKLLSQKPGYLEANYDEILRTLRFFNKENFPELILMEYLPGTIYSVDFLAKDGKAMIVVPKIRILGNASQTIIGMVKRDPVVEEMTSKISEAFGFDYNINIEMGCNAEGIAIPFDFNPRIAASVAFCTAAGANLIYYALKLALGEPIPDVPVKDKVIMMRFFKELYISGGAPV